MIAISQRTDLIPHSQEYHDGLDQRWWHLLNESYLTPLIIPNSYSHAKKIISGIKIKGILLTGGGDSPEREKVETLLLEHAFKYQLPVLGVCHGMQFIQQYFGVRLYKIQNHVCQRQEIFIHNQLTIVNSFHDYGTNQTNPFLTVWAKAADGIIKAIKHVSLPIFGIMWHPERQNPFAARDIELLKNIFNHGKI